MSLNKTTFADAIKVMYPDDEVRDLVLEDHPLLAMIRKKEDVGGTPIHVPLSYARMAGRSASLSVAITNAGNSFVEGFDITTVADYAVAVVDRETALRTKKDDAAFMEAMEWEIDKALSVAAFSVAKGLYGDGLGSIGQIGSVTAADPMVITLLDINDIVNFEYGQIIEADDTAAGTSLRTTPATATVAGVDHDLGTITTGYDNDPSATNWAANDYLFQDGDESATISGLMAWIPSSAPGATSFFGVNRTLDVTRLGGVRVTGTSMPPEQAAHKLAAKVMRLGGKPKWVFSNDVQYHEACISLGSKVEYVEQGVTADVFFSGIRIHGPKGVMEWYPDALCPSTLLYALTPEALCLYSVGPAPHVQNDEYDIPFIPGSTTDDRQVRVSSYAQLGVSAPGWCGVATLDSITY